jgi:hypothetical protein
MGEIRAYSGEIVFWIFWEIGYGAAQEIGRNGDGQVGLAGAGTAHEDQVAVRFEESYLL